MTEGDVAVLDGTGSADPEGAALTYRWSLLEQDGPPLIVPGQILPVTSVQTLDDGQYTVLLEVSDGVHTALDTLALTVVNADPVAQGQIDAPTAGGVALLTASFTEHGPIDTHSATVDWGDGTALEAVPISAEGTGWGSLYAGRPPPRATGWTGPAGAARSAGWCTATAGSG